jgi:hypothetical protein
MNNYKKMFVIFACNEVCEIELTQTESSSLWAETFLANKSKCPIWTRRSGCINHPESIAKNPNKFVSENSPKEINKAIDDIKNLTGVNWPARAFEGMGFEDCNKLHRFFTTSELSHRNFCLTQDIQDKFFEYKINLYAHESFFRAVSKKLVNDVYFKRTNWTTELHNELSRLFHIINSEVHRYEDSCLGSKRTEKLRELLSPVIMLDLDWSNKGHHGQEFIKTERKNMPESSRDYTVDEEINVYQIKSIKGKDYILAFQQYDDPKQWDITKTTVINGGMTIDLNSSRHKFYKSQIFKDWLASNNHPYDENIFGSIPIGKVLSCPDISKVQNTTKSLDECSTKFHSETHQVDGDYEIIDIRFEK